MHKSIKQATTKVSTNLVVVISISLSFVIAILILMTSIYERIIWSIIYRTSANFVLEYVHSFLNLIKRLYMITITTYKITIRYGRCIYKLHLPTKDLRQYRSGKQINYLF